MKKVASLYFTTKKHPWWIKELNFVCKHTHTNNQPNNSYNKQLKKWPLSFQGGKKLQVWHDSAQPPWLWKSLLSSGQRWHRRLEFTSSYGHIKSTITHRVITSERNSEIREQVLHIRWMRKYPHWTGSWHTLHNWEPLWAKEEA